MVRVQNSVRCIWYLSAALGSLATGCSTAPDKADDQNGANLSTSATSSSAQSTAGASSSSLPVTTTSSPPPPQTSTANTPPSPPPAPAVASTSASSSSELTSTAQDSTSEPTSLGSSTDTSASGSGPGSSGNDDTTQDLAEYAAGFHELYIHDECTDNNQSDDVCAHARVHEVPFTFGGSPEATYDVTLRIRGLFEPTNVAGGMTPYPDHPYFKVGGTVTKTDYSQWQIKVTEPAATYYLNHYPETGHTIYAEDFEITIQVRGGSAVVVRVEDSNDRQIDNGYVGLPDRQQTIEGVTDGVVDGQVLRIDVLGVAAL